MGTVLTVPLAVGSMTANFNYVLDIGILRLKNLQNLTVIKFYVQCVYNLIEIDHVLLCFQQKF